MSNVDVQKLQRKAYGEATSVLRANHRSEFDALLDEAYAAHGVSVRRRLSDEARKDKADAKAQAARDRREARAAAKIAKLEAALVSLRGGE